jgi:hypothetical protein
MEQFVGLRLQYIWVALIAAKARPEVADLKPPLLMS